MWLCFILENQEWGSKVSCKTQTKQKTVRGHSPEIMYWWTCQKNKLKTWGRGERLCRCFTSLECAINIPLVTWTWTKHWLLFFFLYTCLFLGGWAATGQTPPWYPDTTERSGQKLSERHWADLWNNSWLSTQSENRYWNEVCNLERRQSYACIIQVDYFYVQIL